MPINFPANPTNGDTYEYGGRTYVWTNGRWALVSAFGETPWDTMPERRNLLINGNFDIWQRGTWFPGPLGNTYAADRWVITDGVDGSANGNMLALTVNTPLIGAAYTMRHVQTVAATSGVPNIHQRIENVISVPAGPVTLSFWARVETGTLVVSPRLQQFYDATTTGPEAYGDDCLVTPEWQRFVRTIQVPDLIENTVDANSHVRFRFDLPLGQTWRLDLGKVQLERGSIDTPFERRHIAEELALCQRYYETGSIRTRLPSGVTSTSTVYGTFKMATKRVTPTLTMSNILLGFVTDPSLTVFGDFIRWMGYLDGTGSPLFHFNFDFTADAEL